MEGTENLEMRRGWGVGRERVVGFRIGENGWYIGFGVIWRRYFGEMELGRRSVILDTTIIKAG